MNDGTIHEQNTFKFLRYVNQLPKPMSINEITNHINKYFNLISDSFFTRQLAIFLVNHYLDTQLLIEVEKGVFSY